MRAPPNDLAPVPANLSALRRFTPARIALGRAGPSETTAASLAFQLDHARARDAVHAALDFSALAGSLDAAGWASLRVKSRVADRAEYLRRPDLGRTLDEPSRAALQPSAAKPADIAIIAADGLSATAITQNLLPLLAALGPLLRASHALAPLILADQARVAIGDEIGEALGVRLTIMLIGERPGLSAADSLGAYVTYGPRRGTLDSNRNCISNIRPAGLSYEEAARQLATLCGEALRLELTGIRLSTALAATKRIAPIECQPA